ncbi:hypothetical protein BH24ACT15_BH24ACT15_08380 [soil metagenome]
MIRRMVPRWTNLRGVDETCDPVIGLRYGKRSVVWLPERIVRASVPPRCLNG